jgi:membrane protease YdiL (CAAX protease family)
MRKVINLSGRPDAGTILFQLFLSSAIALGCAFFVSLLGMWFASMVTGIRFSDFNTSNWADAGPEVISALKIVQVFSQVGLFIIPALILPLILFKAHPVLFDGLNRNSSFLLFSLAFLAYYCFNPALDLSIRINQGLHLPDSMQWLQQKMRNMEDVNNLITQRFLEMPDFKSFLVNTFIIAVLPAFAEEIFFRGFVQGTMYAWFRKKHLAVILTAAIFSFIHFQFFGFLPRMLLGMLLGYLYLWSGNIKISMFVHFLNNFTSVLVSFIYQQQGKNFDINSTTDFHSVIYVMSFIAGGLVTYAFYLNARKKVVREEVADKNAVLPAEVHWEKIFTTRDTYQAEIIMGNLRSEGIDAVVVNKKDSMYTVFGQAELYVPEKDAVRAKEMLGAGR